MKKIVLLLIFTFLGASLNAMERSGYYQDYHQASTPVLGSAESPDELLGCLLHALETRNFHLVIERYMRFIENTQEQQHAFNIILNRIQQGIYENDLDLLCQLAVIVADTQYHAGLQQAVDRIRREQGSDFVPETTGALYSFLPGEGAAILDYQTLQELYNQAVEDHNVNTLLQYKDQIIQQGIVEEEIFEAIIQSMIEAQDGEMEIQRRPGAAQQATGESLVYRGLNTARNHWVACTVGVAALWLGVHFLSRR